MKVKLKVPMSGLRAGVDWPPVGTVMDVDDDEARHLCQAGIAEPVVEERTEKAVAPAAEQRAKEQATASQEPARGSARGRAKKE